MRQIVNFLLLFGFYLPSYAQIRFEFESDGVPVSDVLVEIQRDSIKKQFISDSKGIITSDFLKQGDAVRLNAYGDGYNSILDSILAISNISVRINLRPDILTSVELEGAVIKAKNRNSHKLIYRVDTLSYIKNTKSIIALNSVPNLFVSESFGISYNNKSVLLFIDGAEANVEELKSIPMEDIRNVGITENPPGSYDASFEGVVVNLVLRRRHNNYIKGEIESEVGTRQNRQSYFPYFAYKKDKLVIKGFSSINLNTQDIGRTINRNDIQNSTFFTQSQERNANSFQDYSTIMLNYTFNKNSSINFSGISSGYNIRGNSEGYFSDTLSNITEDYKSDDNEFVRNWAFSSVYANKFGNNTFTAKAKYLDYLIKNEFHYYEGSNSGFSFANSGVKEISAEFVLSGDGDEITGIESTYSVGFKPVRRNFQFDRIQDMNQNIYNLYFNSYFALSKNFSLSPSVNFDYNQNRSQETNKTYFNVLPSISLAYSCSEKRIALSFLNTIVRPSPDKLNPSVLYAGPGNIYQGNSNLIPEKKYTFNLSFRNPFLDETLFSANASYSFSENSIVEKFSVLNGNTVRTFENIGKNKSIGFNVGFSSKFSVVRLNYNAGFSYFDLSTPTNDFDTHGFSFNNNLFISCLLMKKYLMTLTGNYRSPIYSSLNLREIPPSLNLSFERNFFKDRLNINLSAYDLFNMRKKITENYSSVYMYQETQTFNNISNFVLAVRWSFGKDFNDSIISNPINNDDIQLKK